MNKNMNKKLLVIFLFLVLMTSACGAQTPVETITPTLTETQAATTTEAPTAIETPAVQASATYTEIGVGYSFYNNFGYYVIVFAKPK